MDLGHMEVPLTPEERRQAIEEITADLKSGRPPRSMEEVACILKRLVIGTRWSIPTLRAGARLFRVRKMDQVPQCIAEVGAPPAGSASIGRLNDFGNSVLYLSDTPDTAINETRLGAGTYCLSEWHVAEPHIALVNGGISEEDLHAVFGQENAPAANIGGEVDDELRHLFRVIFTLVPSHDKSLYQWSISAAMAGGFAHLCERSGRHEQDGNTIFDGKYPFAGIAYASVRTDQRRVNFAFNDLGRNYVALRNVQWINRRDNGWISSLDFATTWDGDGRIAWLGRPASFVIRAGGAAKLTKVDERVWTCDPLDGDLPGFA